MFLQQVITFKLECDQTPLQWRLPVLPVRRPLYFDAIIVHEVSNSKERVSAAPQRSEPD